MENFIVHSSFLSIFAPELSNDLRFFIDQRSKFNTLKGKKDYEKDYDDTRSCMCSCNYECSGLHRW